MSAASAALLEIHHRFVRLPRTDRVARALASMAEPARSVIDVGTGDGLVAAAIGQMLDADVRGVDVQPQPASSVSVEPFDGRSLPFDDASADVVVLSDVLHHADDPSALLREALRVARNAAVVKDHYAFGPWSTRLLGALDRVGNARQGVPTPGHYFTPVSWLELVRTCGGVVKRQIWPLDVHAPGLRLVTRSELQFVARVERSRTP